jgi:predicted aspartyl protease
MGITYLDARVGGPSGRERTVKFLVDSGATYSVLPDDVWKELGLRPKKEIELVLADGTPVRRQMSECHFALAGEDGHSPVLLGEPGDQALLGVVTLEVLGLVFHPLRRELQPMWMLMA